MSVTLEAVIEDVVINPEKIQPILVNFQNGHLKDEEASRMKCGLYNDEKTNQTVLAMSNGQIVYKGYRPDHNKEMTYTMLAIRNKKTGKVRLVQIERWHVAPVLDEHIESNNEDDVDKVAILNKEFGSKKIKRRTEQYERMKVNVDCVKEQLEKTVSNVEIDKAELEQISNDDFIDGLNLPPCNREANHPSEVYKIEDIIPKNILEILSNIAVEMTDDDFSNKVPFLVQSMEHCKKDSNYAKKIGMLLYIESVLNWLNVPIKMAKKHDNMICPPSIDVTNYVIDSYSVPSANGRLRPNTMKDKGIIHCIILALMIWNYTLDLEMFSTIFKYKMGLKKLIELSRCANAILTKDDKKIVTLKIPLPPPMAKIMPKKKGKK